MITHCRDDNRVVCSQSNYTLKAPPTLFWTELTISARVEVTTEGKVDCFSRFCVLSPRTKRYNNSRTVVFRSKEHCLVSDKPGSLRWVLTRTHNVHHLLTVEYMVDAVSCQDEKGVITVYYLKTSQVLTWRHTQDS